MGVRLGVCSKIISQVGCHLGLSSKCGGEGVTFVLIRDSKL